MQHAYPAAVIGIDQEKSLYQLSKKMKLCCCFKIAKSAGSFGRRAMRRSACELVRTLQYRNLSSLLLFITEVLLVYVLSKWLLFFCILFFYFLFLILNLSWIGYLEPVLAAKDLFFK